MPDLKPLLSPDSVAIIGASADTETLRGRLTHALIGHGYDGRIYPVTRSQSEVLGLRAYPSVAALPEAGRSRGDPGAGSPRRRHDRAMRRARGARRGRHQLGFWRREQRRRPGPRHRAGADRRAPRHRRLRPQFRRHRQSAEAAGCDLQPGVPRSEPEPAARQPARPRPIAVSCQSGALTFSFLSRGRDKQLRFTHQVSAGNQTVPRSA